MKSGVNILKFLHRLIVKVTKGNENPMNHFSNYEDMKRQLFYSQTNGGTDDVCYAGGEECEKMMAPQSGDASQGGTEMSPMTPEGGHMLSPGDNSNLPMMPTAPEGGRSAVPGDNSNLPITPPGDNANIPVTPIAPEGGMPVGPADNPNLPVTPVIPGVIPRPGITILPPILINFATVRVLHAASNYVPIRVTVGNRTIADELAFGTVSGYSRITDGFRIVTVFSTVSNEVLLRATLPFTAGTKITLAVINTANGLEIVTVSDTACQNVTSNRGCFRVANLTYDDGPFDIILSDGRMVFSNVGQKAVTSWKQAVPGDYEFYIMETPYGVMPLDTLGRLEEMPYITQGRYMDASYLLNFYVRIMAGNMYTAYIIGGYYSVTPLQVMVVEN